MKKSLSYVLAAATAMSIAATANATITATVTQVTPLDAALTANGWIGLTVTLVAGGANETVAGMDFTNAAAAAGVGVTGTIGISGPIAQRGVNQKNANPVGTLKNTPNGTGADTSTPATINDSYWITPDPPYLSVASPSTENNNRANLATNLPNNYTGSPETDTPNSASANGVDFGVGSLMTQAAVVDTANQVASQDIAFVIVPSNVLGGNNVTLKGVATDNFGNIFPIDIILNPSAVTTTPEPASLGLLGLSGAGLLLRRKNKR